MHAWTSVCVFLCLCMCEFTCFCGWVNSNMHCTLFYSDPTRRHKQRAQPHLIICNGNSLHFHNILFQQTFRYQEEDQSEIRTVRVSQKHCQCQWGVYGGCLVAEKRKCKHIHHSTWLDTCYVHPVPSASLVYTAGSHIGCRLPWSP